MKTLRISALVASGLLIAASSFAAVSETFKQNYPFSPTGVISLDNVNGNIEIVAWDKSEVAVEAEKKAKDDEALKRIFIEVDAKSDRLVIKTKYEKSGMFNSNGSVSYKLMVPSGVSLSKIDSTNSSITVKDVRGSVELDTTNGNIVATGLAGDAKLDSTNGGLRAEFVSLQNVKSINLDTTNGRINLTLPKGANADIDAETTNGSISVEPAIKLTKSSKREIRGQIGVGGTKVELDTTNGSVTIKEG